MDCMLGLALFLWYFGDCPHFCTHTFSAFQTDLLELLQKFPALPKPTRFHFTLTALLTLLFKMPHF
jgi:hypothetical protein